VSLCHFFFYSYRVVLMDTTHTHAHIRALTQGYVTEGVDPGPHSHHYHPPAPMHHDMLSPRGMPHTYSQMPIDHQHMQPVMQEFRQPVQAVPLQMVHAQPAQYVQYVQPEPVHYAQPVHYMPRYQPRSEVHYETFVPPPYEINEPYDEPQTMQKERKSVQRSAPPPPPKDDSEEEDLPVFPINKQKKKSQRSAGPPPTAPAPVQVPPAQKVEIRRREIEIDKVDIVPNEREITYYDVVPTERTVDSDRIRENVREHVSQIPQFVERIITKDVPVPNLIKKDRIIEKVIVKVWV
jgi:hypothetical protein